MTINANIPQCIKPLHMYPQVAASEDIMMFLCRVTMDTKLGAAVYDDMQKDQLFTFMVGVKRAEGLGIKLSKSVMATIAVLSNGPGAVVMYLHAVYQKQLQLQERDEDREVSILDFCEMFAMGFPDERTMTKAWDAQKDMREGARFGHNLIDIPEVFKARYVEDILKPGN